MEQPPEEPAGAAEAADARDEDHAEPGDGGVDFDEEFDEDPKELMQEVTQNPRFARVLAALREQEQSKDNIAKQIAINQE